MSDVAIRVENLGKMYRIGGKQEAYSTLRDTLSQAFSAPFRRASQLLRGQAYGASELGESIWALKDVSFEVKQGEVIGIIGKNGAGKSTLLKILSQITEPTTGYIDVFGRVGSLLEVGTGFHPELTGRENIYLNGAILGMSRAEIDRKFDEIVDFSGVEKFIDTPVKHYSSGMGLRLGFAVAAHLEPDILVVDEVLAVGDAEFQKKCLGKMQDVAGQGRTVLFVSHNLSAVETLCSQAMLLAEGGIELLGNTQDIISFYLQKNHKVDFDPFTNAKRSGNGKFRVTSFHLEDENGNRLSMTKSGRPVVFCFGYENYTLSSKDRISFGFSVSTAHESALFQYYSHFSNHYYSSLQSTGYIRCQIPALALVPGIYLVGCRVIAYTGEEIDWPHIYFPITVEGADFYEVGTVTLPNWGSMLVKGAWS